MKVLLIYPVNSRPTHIVPLGLGYVGAVLRQGGYKVRALDIDAYRFSTSEIRDFLKNTKYDVACVSGLISVFNYARWLADEVKRANPSVKVLAGGALVSAMPHLLVGNSQVDVGATGEGEQVILELMRAFETGSKLDDIPGIVFKRGGQVIQTKPVERIKNLDAIPFPAHDLFPVDIYLKRSPIYGYTKHRHMPILGSRGCPYPCTYCDRAFGKSTYYRSIESIMEEIAWLKRDFGVQVVSFIDDYFFPDKERIYELCEAFQTRHPDIKWHCVGRVDKVDPGQLTAMARAGCVSIGYGIESGSPTVLKEMKKHITVEQARNAMRWAWEAGIRPGPSFLVGMPGETAQTMRESAEFRKEINRYLPKASENTFWVTPLPGTELYAHSKRVGLITDDLEYITRYSDIHTIWNFFMNLTKLPSDEIRALKAQAQKEIFRDFYRKHPGKFVGQYLWPRLLRYAGVEFAGRAVRKALKIYRKRAFLQKDSESPTSWDRNGFYGSVVAKLDALLNVNSDTDQAH